MADQPAGNNFTGLKNPLVQSFLSPGQYLGKRGVFYDAYDEPTYLGFYVEFDFNIGDIEEGNQNELPSGLLAKGEKNYSAETYLKNIGYPDRAMNVQAFRTMLESLTKKTPWYITSVDGLSEIYKIAPNESFRAKDKKITLSFLEGIDMRISSMFDLYRKAAFDTVYMRYMLPDIMRSFTMNVYVTEFRTFHGPANAKELDDPGYQKIGQNSFGIDTSKGPISQLSSQVKDFFNGGASEIVEKQGEKLNDWVRGSGEFKGNDTYYLQYLDKHVSVVKFSFTDCEFILDSLEPSWGVSLSSSTSEQATYKVNIKIGKIRETASYPIILLALQNLSLSVEPDSAQFSDKNFNDVYLSEPTYDGIKANGPSFNRQEISRKIHGEFDNPDKVYTSGPYREGHLKPLADVNKKGLGERLVNNLETAAFGRLSNASPIDGALLGNVYGLTPLSLLRRLSENPLSVESALRDIIRGSNGPNAGEQILNNIYQNLPEPGSLLDGNVGNAGLTGSIAPISGGGTVGLTGANANTGGNPGNIGLVGIPSSQGNPGNAGLTGPATNIEGNPGNAGLAGNTNNTEGNPGTVGLTGPNSNVLGNPGNIELRQTNSKLSTTPGNVELSSNNSNLNGPLSNIGLKSNSELKTGDPGNVGLTGTGSSIEGNSLNVGLREGNNTIDGDPGNVGLTVAESSIKTPGNIGLSAQEIKSVNPGNVGLSSPIQKEEELGNVGLVGENKNLTNPGNIGLTGTTIINENPGNVGLSSPIQKEEELGNVGLVSENKNLTNPGNIGLTGTTIINENPGNVGLSGSFKKAEIIDKVDLTGEKRNFVEPGNIGFTEEKTFSENLGNIGFDKTPKKEQTLENIGFVKREKKDNNLGNVGLKSVEPTNSILGNIGFIEKKKISEIEKSIGLSGAEPVKKFLNKIDLTSTEPNLNSPKNIGLEGQEKSAYPEQGSEIQNSSKDLPRYE